MKKSLIKLVQEKSQIGLKLNKFEETTCGLSHVDNDARDHDGSPVMLTKAVVVVNHLASV